jgi:hypothetical protein
MARRVANVPGAGLVFVPQKTARFAVGSWLRQKLPVIDGHPPSPRLTLGLTAQVALDELMLGWMKSPRRYPAEADYAAVARELREAAVLYRERGFVARPETYHRDPEPIAPTVERKWSSGLGYERLSWPSAYTPHEGEPGRDRWLAFEANRTSYAYALRGDPTKPWLMCIHGFGTGMALTEFFAFRARRLHQELGLNLLFPVLPIHGPRKVGRLGGQELMSYELQNFVLGMAQAMVDIRGAIGWIREQGGETVGVHGMSLGAYVGSLLVTIEPGLEMVLAGAPLCDIPKLFEHHSTVTLRRQADPDGTLGAVAKEVHTVISPLARPPLVPEDRRYVYAGLGDRMSTPPQAQRLWEHWGRPKIAWYEGSHLTFLWSSTVTRFVEDALRESGLVTRTPPPPRTARPAAGTNGRDPRPGRS